MCQIYRVLPPLSFHGTKAPAKQCEMGYQQWSSENRNRRRTNLALLIRRQARLPKPGQTINTHTQPVRLDGRRFSASDKVNDRLLNAGRALLCKQLSKQKADNPLTVYMKYAGNGIDNSGRFNTRISVPPYQKRIKLVVSEAIFSIDVARKSW